MNGLRIKCLVCFCIPTSFFLAEKESTS